MTPSQRIIGISHIFPLFFCLILFPWLSSGLVAQDRKSPTPGNFQPAVQTGDDPADGKVSFSTNVISLAVSVSDKNGKFISGLDQKSFQVLENKIPQEISFFSAQDSPASIGVVFDISGSMTGKKIASAREALQRFIQTSHQEDDYCLIGFNQKASLLLENSMDSEALLSRLMNIRPEGSTALYDAILLGLDQVSKGRWSKRALIVLSDGDDNNSRAGFRQIRKAVQEADVTIYTVRLQDGMLSRFGAAVMEDLASVSGGKSWAPDNADEMSEVFEKIALELRQQYSIGYVPSGFVADGKWRKLKVNVTVPDSLTTQRVVVRARPGYYAIADRHKRLGETED